MCNANVIVLMLYYCGNLTLLAKITQKFTRKKKSKCLVVLLFTRADPSTED